MKYNFDEVVDRSKNRSAKYDERKRRFGTDQVIPLWIADMDFKTAQPVIDACEAKAREGIWGYTTRPDSYFQAVQDWEERYYGWRPHVDLMSWGLGVIPSIATLLKLHTKPGDRVLIQTPVYSEFYDVPEGLDRIVVESPLVEKEGSWEIDFADFERKARECRVFILCSPHNPVGKVWTREELKKMVDICLSLDVLVISDEIHSDLVFHGKKHIRTATLSPEIAKKVITCVSLTKTFNLAGLQAGTVIFPDKKTRMNFQKYWMALDVWRNNAFSSVAMEAAYREGHEWLEQLLVYISGNFDFVRDYCEKYIPKIKPNLPDATYLMWLDCRGLGLDNKALKQFMIEKAGLGLNEGDSFGRSLKGYMRMNVACPRSLLEKALGQLKKAVDAL